MIRVLNSLIKAAKGFLELAHMEKLVIAYPTSYHTINAYIN